jgi:hypothetical protein
MRIPSFWFQIELTRSCKQSEVIQRFQQYLDLFSDCECGRGPNGSGWDEEVDRDEYRGCLRADYIASAIYQSQYGENILEACYDNRGWPREGLE